MSKYQIIYADPPWQYEGEMMGSSVTDHYPTMSAKEIKRLPVRMIAAADSSLFIWVTMPKLNIVMDVISAWGFEFKTCAFTWVKTNPGALGGYFMGQGRWTRANAELCLLGTRGNPHRLDTGVRQLVVSDVMDHSHKPAIVRERITQLLGDLPRIELFARKRVAGWDSWGNEIDSNIKLTKSEEYGWQFIPQLV